MKNNQMLSGKAPAKNLDGNNQKILQKIVGKFLNYSRVLYPIMLMALNSLIAVQTKPTIKTAKEVTQFLNYSVTHPDAVTDYRRSGMILHIYYNVSYILEPEAQSRYGVYFS